MTAADESQVESASPSRPLCAPGELRMIGLDKIVQRLAAPRRLIALACLFIAGGAAAQEPPPVPWSAENETQFAAPPAESWVSEEALAAPACQGGYCCKCPRCC